jgi:hypothetical protein
MPKPMRMVISQGRGALAIEVLSPPRSTISWGRANTLSSSMDIYRKRLFGALIRDQMAGARVRLSALAS